LNWNLPYDFSVVPGKFLFFKDAALMTLEITTLGILVGFIIGLIVAFAKISRLKIFNVPAASYIYIIRGTPLLLQLFVIYYGLASVIRIPEIPSAFIALGIHNGAYLAEILRGAIQSIDRGQMEAARSLGMTQAKAMRRIILPQAFKRAIPPLGNQFIIATKDSSLASTIAVPELILKARQIGSSTFLYMEMLVTVAIWYLLMTTTLTIIVNKIENRLKVSEYQD